MRFAKSISMREEVWKKVEELANRKGEKVSKIIEDLLIEKLNEIERENNNDNKKI